METKIISSEQDYRNFLSSKEILEKKAIEIGKRITEINPKEVMARDIDKIEFYDDCCSIDTSGYCRGPYTEYISFPISYMWDENWEKKYIEELENKKLEALQIKEKEEKKIVEDKEKKELETYEKLKLKFENKTENS